MSRDRPLGVIVAVADNGIIGAGGDLPWRLPEDMKHFRRTTMGHAVIMGRKTWESLGRPLKGRDNIVVTRQAGYDAPGAQVAAGLDEALALVRPDDELPFVIGGASLYAEALPRATVLHLTEVHARPEGDTWFPELDRSAWREAERREGDGCSFVTFIPA